jgi:hypothetical protein
MPLLVVGVLIGVLLCALYKAHTSSSSLRIFDDGETYIVIEGGSVRVRRGWVPERAMAALADTLRNAGVGNGHITMSRDNRVAISWHIPPALHQTIRNILLLERGVATPAGGCGASHTN